MDKTLFILSIIVIFLLGCAEETVFNTVVPVDINPENILKSCLNVEQREMVVDINFPEYNEIDGCHWNSVIDGVANLSKLNEFIRARAEETIEIDLPENFILCGVNIESDNDDLHYDDVLFFTMNKYILTAGSGAFLELFKKENGVSVWDFSKIRDTNINEYPWDDSPYCLGDSSTCVIPTHDHSGPFDLMFESEILSNVAGRIIEEEKLIFSLITTGDNDNYDCFHTEFNLRLRLKYVTELID